ncbi:immune-associated nucleotide-binding protein 9 [Aplysia californica]|uniref:Immune-associated nucleotide-binding protein 9 n=1 Tax=Aplysia californica TaxID=6500 RepID=A0ABM0JQ17_APLCA|nr:immune-associated nucleotide-binding protein 9 [Aplysia californica]
MSASVNSWPPTMMLLGKVGHGKTATASSVLERRISYNVDEETTVVFFSGRATSADGVSKVDVIDSPGLFNTFPVDDAQDTTRMFEQIEKAIGINDDGINAFVIVFRFGTRYTDDEQKVVRNLEQAFGPSFPRFFADHVIIVFTYGSDYRLKHGSAPFEGWVLSQMADMKKLFKMCQGRCLLFDNVTCSPETATEQREKLLDAVSRMTRKFTIEDYEKTMPHRMKLLSELTVSNKWPKVRRILQTIFRLCRSPFILLPLSVFIFISYFYFPYSYFYKPSEADVSIENVVYASPKNVV